MTEATQGAGSAGANGGAADGTDPDLDPAERYATEVGVDPSPQEIERYRRLEGDEPLGDTDDGWGDPAESGPGTSRA